MILPKSDKCVIPEIFSRGSMDSRFKRAGMTNLNYQRGVSLLELILVIVIMAIGAALVIPRLEQGVENRRAKDALETLKTISNAVRLYELNTGSFPPSGLLDQEDAIPPGPPHVLESGGYLNPKEYAPSFNYSINSAATPV
ncbi:MAG: prepilin-type N-terminal cleavage/methylation domain-containing protein, partial [Candidatus Omnitrophica bacterium]|nr:prepilin-type N-terminal cleavage/methylation domain-containing protein [Candidatus Omnitrophota bacterium]